jgi:GNAT superfamily N-acetyltransferase
VALIRVATTADVGALVELRRRWGDERGAAVDEGFGERFRAWFAAEAHQRSFWLAEDDGEPIGMANLLTFERMPTPGRDAGRWGYLGNMYVVADHRDRGVGRQLLEALVTFADDRGLVRIVLSPSERSVAFYRRAGFDAAGELLVRPRTAHHQPAD